MLNEVVLNKSKIIKYFKNIWRQGEKILVEAGENPGELLISDLLIIIKVPTTLKLFNDPKMFPELPQPGKCFTYQITGFNRQGPKIHELIKVILQENLKKLTMTRWLFSHETIARLFYADKKYLFVNQMFLDLFNLDIGSYQVYSSLKSATAPVVLINDKDNLDIFDRIFAVILPLWIDLVTDEDKFPAIPDLNVCCDI